jgi:hypothetical protein
MIIEFNEKSHFTDKMRTTFFFFGRPAKLSQEKEG